MDTKTPVEDPITIGINMIEVSCGALFAVIRPVDDYVVTRSEGCLCSSGVWKWLSVPAEPVDVVKGKGSLSTGVNQELAQALDVGDLPIDIPLMA